MWINCRVEVFSPVQPSEDPQKVKEAILNVISVSQSDVTDTSVKASSDDIISLQKIQEVIKSRRSQKAYQKNLRKNLIGDTTWIYLNKQAAFVGKVSLCEEESESPLGPIKVILTSREIDRVIDWFVNA